MGCRPTPSGSWLNHARELLRAGEDIAGVAVETGFTDQSHLGRFGYRFYALYDKLSRGSGAPLASPRAATARGGRGHKRTRRCGNRPLYLGSKRANSVRHLSFGAQRPLQRSHDDRQGWCRRERL
jgi:AraC-like DNA-binding protein